MIRVTPKRCAVKLLRCGIACEALRRNTPLGLAKIGHNYRLRLAKKKGGSRFTVNREFTHKGGSLSDMFKMSGSKAIIEIKKDS